MKECAKSSLSYAAAIAVSSAVRERVGNVDLMPSDCHSKTSTELASLIRSKAQAEFTRVENGIDLGNLESVTKQQFDHLKAILDQDTSEWQTAVPGKPVLAAFCKRANIPLGRAKTLYIKRVHDLKLPVFDEIVEIFQSFNDDR
jgi:hypothetical protein